MNTTESAARGLAALGHEARLGIFRLLVKAGHEGLTVGRIAEHLDMAPSTLAHHLRALASAGLIVQSRNGREVTTRAQFDTMTALVGFLTDQCCTGVDGQSKDTAA